MFSIAETRSRASLLYGADRLSGWREVDLIRRIISDVGVGSLLFVDSANIARVLELSNSLMLIILGWEAGRDESIFLRLFRQESPYKPVLIMGARNDCASRAKAFELGADNYLGPEYSATELRAKVCRLSRLSQNAILQRASISIGDVQFWPDAKVVLHNGNRLNLSGREIAMLICLAKAYPKPVNRETLEREAFGLRHDPGTNRVAVHVHRIRKKIEQSGNLLLTVPGQGYRLASS